jgi:hypothetical protein
VNRLDFGKPESIEELREPPYPRWIVVSGVILYCSLFWGIIWVAGVSGVAWVRAATASAQ